MTNPCRSWAAGIAIWLLVSGCTTMPLSPVPAAVEPNADESPRWWNIRFQMDWPGNENPAWHVDLALAHKIVSPVLEKYTRDISLWRFHRRAMRDKTGHQFSFVFYASQRTAKEVSDRIASSPDLSALKDAGVVIKDTYDSGQLHSNQSIEGASDAGWSLPIQKSWPYFIMGVSKTWLVLIEDFAKQPLKEDPLQTVHELLAFYKGIDDAINLAWQEEGGHAFLHHLNAVFEYKDVSVYEKRLLTF